MTFVVALRRNTLLLAFLISPAFAAPPMDVTRVSTEEPLIAFTFDGGSSAEGATELLDVLVSSGIRTTVFLTGEFIESHPEIVLRIVSDGHEVANHTWSHPHLTTWSRRRTHVTAPGITESMLREELERTASAFEALTGRSMAPYWRAPYGEQNRTILQWAESAGWKHVGWTRGRRTSLDTLDWVVNRRAGNYLDPAGIARRVLDFESVNDTSLDGSIVLMHLGTGRPVEQRLARVLPHLIDELTSRGFRFVTVGELLASPVPQEAR